MTFIILFIHMIEVDEIIGVTLLASQAAGAFPYSRFCFVVLISLLE